MEMEKAHSREKELLKKRDCIQDNRLGIAALHQLINE